MRLTMTMANLLAAGTAGAIGFADMEIYRFERGTSQLLAHDLNRDGRDDLVFANNTLSRLEVLIRQVNHPPPETGRAPRLEEVFDNQGVVVDQAIIACRIADLDTPGQPSVITMGREQGLVIYPFETDGLQTPRKIHLKHPERLMDIQTADLSGNGRPELVICRKDNLEILWNDGHGNFYRRTEMKITPPDALKIELADFTGNGHADLLIFISATPTLLRLRQGHGDGSFGAEHILPIAPGRRSAAILPDDRPALIGSIIQNGRGLRLSRLQREPPRNILQQDELLPQRIALRPASRQPAAWTIGDFTGNGYDDLCVSSSDLGQLHVFPGSTNGLTATPLTYATLSGISAISQTGSGDLLVFSSTEKTAALHPRERMDEFPRLLLPPGPPLLAVAHPEQDAFYWLCRDPETRQASLSAFDLASGTNSWLDQAPIDLPNDPDALLTFPLPDDRVGLMFFIPHRQPLLLVCDGRGDLSKIESSSYNPAAYPLRPSMVTLPDRGRLVLTMDKLAREFLWQNQSWQPVGQLTSATDTIQLAAITPFRDAGRNGLLLLDRESNDLLWFHEDKHPLRQIHSGFPLINTIGMGRLRGPDPDRDEGLVLLTPSEILLFHNRTGGFRITTETEYTSPAEDPSLADFRLVRLDDPRRSFLVLTDTRNHALELLALANRKPTAALVFEVFQTPEFGPGARPTVEPREVTAGDITGNGIGDLVLLVHDKLIIYRGE